MSGQVTLGQLQAMGLVATNPLVERTVSIKYFPLKPKGQWADPAVEEREDVAEEAEMTVFLRRFTAADRISIAGAKGDSEIAYIAIQRTVFTADGAHVFPTIDVAYGLDLEMFAPLLAEIYKLNNIGAAAKKSRPRTSSGAKSRSPSAAGASPNGRKRSQLKSSTSGPSTDNATAR